MPSSMFRYRGKPKRWVPPDTASQEVLDWLTALHEQALQSEKAQMIRQPKSEYADDQAV